MLSFYLFIFYFFLCIANLRNVSKKNICDFAILSKKKQTNKQTKQKTVRMCGGEANLESNNNSINNDKMEVMGDTCQAQNGKLKQKLIVQFTPTIPHCSMATLIGLSIRVKLMRSLPQRFKINVKVTPGTHSTENEINKQLNDKERVAAALENSGLTSAVNRCIETSINGVSM